MLNLSVSYVPSRLSYQYLILSSCLPVIAETYGEKKEKLNNWYPGFPVSTLVYKVLHKMLPEKSDTGKLVGYLCDDVSWLCTSQTVMGK